MDDLEVQELWNFNEFYHPELCHVCKKRNNGKFLPCHLCKMIFYCCDEHKQMHLIEHIHFCLYIIRYLRENITVCDGPSTTIDWIKSRRIFLDTIKQRMHFRRILMVHEEQMILFAKSCRICHLQYNLHCCNECYSDYYCDEHAEDFQIQHSSNCKNLKLHFDLDNTLAPFNHSHLLNNFPDPRRNANHMDTFIKQYLNTGRDTDYTLTQYFYSDYVSGPLTLYYGICNGRLIDRLCSTSRRDECVVHVITANYLDIRYVEAWELFLHLLHPRIMHLKIVLIGRFHIPYVEMNVCNNCVASGSTMSYECYPVLYCMYKDMVEFRQPNVIVAFQVDLKQADLEWISFMSIAQRDNIDCPFIITAKSENTAEKNINEMKNFLGSNLVPLYNIPNNFTSLRPWREFETGSVFYRNVYVTIYKNLIISSKIKD